MKTDVDFLYNVVGSIHKLGVVGEDLPILCLLLKISLRLVKNSDPISSNLVVSDKSGSGKDFLVRNVCGFVLPKDCYEHYTRVSEKALNYYKINWDTRVLHLEDIEFNFLNSSVIKTMASNGSKVLVTNVGNKTAESIEIGL